MEYADELLPALRELRSQGTHIYASIGYPHISNMIHKGKQQSLDLVLSIINLYDKILIHTPDELEVAYFAKTFANKELKTKYTAFLKKIHDKILYTGYILPEMTKTSPRIEKLLRNKNKKHTIIVSRGGGAVYPKIIANAIRAQKLLGDKYQWIICAGPSTSEPEKELFRALMEKNKTPNIKYYEYLADLPFLLKNADVSVSMCGYNTSVQLLRWGTPSVIVPYRNTAMQLSSNEQLARSQLLSDTIQSSVLDYDTMTPQELASAVESQCERKQPHPAPAKWFSGRKKTVKYLRDQRP